MIRVFILTVTLALPWSAGAVDLSGTITILEGDALVYRGAGSVRGVEGLRLARGDIVETAASAFAQIEFTDQSIAQFGPATRAMINSSAERQKPERWLYLMEGWAKLSGGKHTAAAGAPFELRSPLIDIPANSAVVVLRHSPSEVSLYVERGE